MTSPRRIQPNARMSAAVVHGDTVYLAGVVAKDPAADVTAQTEQVLRRIDELLAEAGTDRARLLTATIWLRDISTFEQMNAVWDRWIDTANPPARATVEAHLARPEYLVEIQVVASRG